ncbi:F pilus assembly [Pectobacterium atrosepticum ICMP 1526]|nr:F pilus assembly [Pectobacterium atrosepticum ICMP 1526]
MICTIHLTPRCRRPTRGQVSLARLLIDADSTVFTLPSQHFRTDKSIGERAVHITDKHASLSANGLLLMLQSQPTSLVTTSIWRVQEQGEPIREVRHVVQWLLPQRRTSLMTDDTWIWPDVSETPPLSPGDWPVMDITTPPYSRIQRRGLTIIDTRNRHGRLIRRFQTFPLVALAADTFSERIPDTLIPLT